MRNFLAIAGFTLLLGGCASTPTSENPLVALRTAAEAGQPGDQYRFALALHDYEHNEGRITDRSLTNIGSWYKKAADQGHVQAQANLGALLRRNPDIPLGHAVSYLSSAAQAGDIVAQYNLGEYYDPRYGRSEEPKDIESAIAWYMRAAVQGSLQAQNQLAEAYAENNNLTMAYAWFSIAKQKRLSPSAQGSYDRLLKRIMESQKVEGERFANGIIEKHPSVTRWNELVGQYFYAQSGSK